MNLKQFQADKNRIINQVGSESIVSSVYNSSCFSFRYWLLAEEGLKEREHVQPLLCVPCSFLPGLFYPYRGIEETVVQLVICVLASSSTYSYSGKRASNNLPCFYTILVILSDLKAL